jgi:DNA polymerase/3'-5' exonuclease PolX
MTEKIIEILKENETLTQCKQYFLVKRKDYRKVANEIESAIELVRTIKN